MEKKITINVRKATTTRGQSFYKTSTCINGVWYKVAFNKSAGARPEQAGIYELAVDTLDLSVSAGKYYTTKDGEPKQENDTLWVAKYTELRKLSSEELRQRDQAKIDSIFGD